MSAFTITVLWGVAVGVGLTLLTEGTVRRERASVFAGVLVLWADILFMFIPFH